MDSSRNSLLSTLLMTLPLIVVPAIALLRPPGNAGMASVPLAAAPEEDSFLSSFEDLDLQGADPSAADSATKKSGSDVDWFFEESESESSGQTNRSADSQRKPMDSQSPFREGDSDEDEKSAPDDEPEPQESETPATEDAQFSAEAMVEQLNALGAIRTIWFDAGARSPVGFAAFFRGSNDETRIRFEAVGQTREECARNVLNQVTRWQAVQP